MDVLDWVRALVALVTTLALIALAALGARRLGMLQGGLAGAPRRMRVVERLALDPRRSVLIVRVDGDEHVVLLSPFGELKLGDVRNPPPPAGEGDVKAANEGAGT
jgi:flagellar protein FliO/FliZ